MTDRSTTCSAEDAKLVTLARATRARTGAAEGAAVRDLDGRTYAAATVGLPSLQLSALQVCVAMAVASGSAASRRPCVLDRRPTATPDLGRAARLRRRRRRRCTSATPAARSARRAEPPDRT